MVPKMHESLIQHMKQQYPVLDDKDMFMFFSNNKVAQTSINRHLLKGRCVVRKDDNQKYDAKLASIADFDSIWKFTIVRNPWDRVVSAFFYLKKHASRLPMDIKSMKFEHFVMNVLQKHGTALDAHFEPQFPKAFYDGNCFVDFIARMENIESDWKTIAQSISAPSELPHRNKSKHKDYRSYYGPKPVEVIRDLYSEDIDKFGYSFFGDNL